MRTLGSCSAVCLASSTSQGKPSVFPCSATRASSSKPCWVLHNSSTPFFASSIPPFSSSASCSYSARLARFKSRNSGAARSTRRGVLARQNFHPQLIRPRREPGLQIKRRFRIPHAAQAQCHHPGRCQRHKVAGHHQAGVAIGAAAALGGVAIDDGDAETAALKIMRRAQPHYAGAENHNVLTQGRKTSLTAWVRRSRCGTDRRRRAPAPFRR